MSELVGTSFNRLTILAVAESGRRGASRWLCRCVCGVEKIVLASNVKRGLTKSCGCLSLEITREQGFKNAKHRDSNSRTYWVWASMKARCLNPKSQGYKLYGGRGIKVCDRWLNSYEAFLADMGEVPLGRSIERDDVNGNYEPNNCRWATTLEQMNNRRSNVIVEFNGRRQNISQWAREMRVSRALIGNRLRAGWPVEKALTQARR